jgi:spore coat protein CotH
MFLFVLVTLVLSFSQIAAQTDSTDFLFDDSAVHGIPLTFYVSDWQTQLEANYIDDAGYIPARFSDGKITLDSVGVRYKGNSSYNAAGSSPKKPFKIKFNEFISGQKYYGIKILNFSNAYGDPTLLREKIAYDIAAKYMPSPRSTFATITIGSELIGLYTQIEQIDKQFLGRYFTNDSLNLFKASDAGLLFSTVVQTQVSMLRNWN